MDSMGALTVYLRPEWGSVTDVPRNNMVEMVEPERGGDQVGVSGLDRPDPETYERIERQTAREISRAAGGRYFFCQDTLDTRVPPFADVMARVNQLQMMG